MEREIDRLVGEMTLDEKIGMVHGEGLFQTKGVERLGIPPLRLSDGPMGVRNEFQKDKWIPLGNSDDYVSYLPSNSAIASTWSTETAEKVGNVLGEEARGRGKDVILAPGINIKRSPLCGRNFEYLSEDPMLTADMTVALVKGIQKNDVASCVKHFAVNSQETNRLHLDTVVDERTLQEIYYPAFKAAVQEASAYSVMGAYNKLNGEYCCENVHLLKEVLQEEWGFDGTVISDWGAVHRTKEAAEAPLDIEMSIFDNFDEYCLANPLKKSIEAGETDIELLNQKVRNILRMMFRLKMIGSDAGKRKKGSFNTPEHRKVLREAAEKSVILLKNEEETLPLKGDFAHKRIAVIGQNAEKIHSDGGGSAEIKALYEISPLLGIKMEFGGNTQVSYAPGYYIPKKQENGGENWQASSVEDKNEIQKRIKEMKEEKKRLKRESFLTPMTEKDIAYQEEALRLAKENDEVIFIGGLNHEYDVEGEDRPYMKLPYHQDELIQKLLEVNSHTVIVLIAGSPVEMPWQAEAKAIVWSYYAGMETGTALAGVLSGRVNPGGKLAETFPYTYEDTPTGENGQFALEEKVTYEEGLMVGYRYYETKQRKPMFAFGHGLSYTHYEYKNLHISAEQDKELTVRVSFEICNVGKRAGTETAQLYVEDETASVFRPSKELKAFHSVFLKSGETVLVEIILDRKAFQFYDAEQKTFRTEPGVFRIYVGASVQDIALQGEVNITKEMAGGR